MYLNVNDIRNICIEKYKNQDFVIDKTGQKLIEILGASFIADEETIFGKLNKEYVQKELDWYLKKSLNVYDMDNPPTIWKQVADDNGFINSNYGYLIFSDENYNQYKNVLNELKQHPFSRRAVMIYTRPSMQYEYNKNGMSDFICTNAVSYFIRNNKVHCIVQMRSNDIVFGYKNDRYWQKYVLEKLAGDLQIESGNIYWQVANLHLYERHFYIIKDLVN